MKTFWNKKKSKALKPSKLNIWKLSMNKPVKHFYGDSDGDGVMNMFDCQPYNKKKQGSEHERAENRRANDMFDKAARNAEMREKKEDTKKYQDDED
jgi:hypothetical protein